MFGRLRSIVGSKVDPPISAAASAAPPAKKTWESAQRYELDHAYGFMSEPYFVDLFGKFQRGELQTSTGYINELFLREFFENQPTMFEQFIAAVRGKACLDIGPCVFTPIVTWDGVGERYAIEPLGELIRDWQRDRFGSSAFDRLHLKALAAEVFIDDLAGKIDGAIHCRNMLDHTPKWPFVLSNMSAYAASGCKLLFWTDIDHRGTADEGHFDICSEASSLKRLLEQLGFAVEREFEDVNRRELNWGCVAVKR